MNTELLCPDCQAPLPAGVLQSCPACGIRLVGPDAVRLWQVNQRIAALQVEAVQLLERLRRTPVEAPAATAGPGAVAPSSAGGPLDAGGYPSPYPTPYPAPGRPQPGPRGVTGQQLLLGLGALLLLSAASFFLAVIWFAVGLVGQAMIMAALTATAMGGAALGTRVRLPAAAETGAVIASGLVLLDLWAAHRLGLAGLERVPTDVYWAVAAAVGAAVLLGADLLVPRRRGAEELHRIWTYRPAATGLLGLSGWAGLVAVVGEPAPGHTAVLVCLGALVLTGLSAAGAWAAYQVDGSPWRVGALPWSAVPLLVSTAFAAVLHLLAGMFAGFDPEVSGLVRYGAVALLLVLPVAVEVGHRTLPALQHRLTELRLLAALWILPAAGIVLYDLHRGVLAGVAVVVAALLASAYGGLLPGVRVGADTDTPRKWWLAGPWALLPLVTAMVWWLVEERAASYQSVAAGLDRVGEGPWVLPLVPALAWTVAALVPAVRTLRADVRAGAGAGWLAQALVAGSAASWIALRDADAAVWTLSGLLVLAGLLALAAVLHPWPAEAPALAGAAVHALVALVWAGGHSATLQGVALVVTGVLVLAYALLPERLLTGYVATFLASVGVSMLLGEAGVGLVEAHATVPTLLLAWLGFLQWRNNPRVPTLVSMGPALVAALGPSLLVGIEEGGALRLAGVSAAALGVLVLGLSRHWQAPVLVGGATLGIVAITQGGPYLAYVDGWILLGLAGVAALGIGIAWEQSVQAGRRTAAWLGQLR